MSTHMAVAAASAVLVLSASAMAQGDPKAGQDVFFKQCIACHAFTCNRIGPKLQGLFGRTAGTLSDYPTFTDAIKSSGIVWDAEKLNQFLADPTATIPGTAMWVGKVEDAQARRDLIAFLQQPDTSVDLCPE